ncbi:MAG: hypothetical protein PHX60_01235 [Giesbergeria sp.]|uniref:hypothetical protein n=1 Tax=Giesbergeria sp. TaxID=2818473 RepID=UPI0026166794|nr:hypothetical protein [Giesbergeria sp.]MDD2608303.1 hypothetical protein [Giesbergeria sp.]
MTASPHPLLESALQTVELQLQALSAALLAPDPQALQNCSERMRQVSVDFIKALEGLRVVEVTQGLEERIRQIHATLSLQRDSLARLAALADRQAAVLLPPAHPTHTYGPATNGAARIYSAAG